MRFRPVVIPCLEARRLSRSSLGSGLARLAGKVFRFGHLGQMSDVMALSGLSVLEMCMADLGWPVKLGSGVAAAQEYYRGTVPAMALAAE